MHYATDPRGHSLSSTNEVAVAACNAGIESFNRNRADAMSHLDAAIAADDGFALPRLAKAWMLQSARDANYAESIQALIRAAEACLDESDERDGSYLTALKLAFSGRGIESATILEALLDRYPTDLLAHRLVQYELFWNGRAQWMLDIAERAAPYWSESVEGYATFLSCRAFSNEEAGRYTQAEHNGRAAVELDNTEPWGAHSIAHVLFMQGRNDEGIAWLEGLSPNWHAANQLRHHLWWHLCLFLLECTQHERILTLLTTEIRNPDSPLVKANSGCDNGCSKRRIDAAAIGNAWCERRRLLAGTRRHLCKSCAQSHPSPHFSFSYHAEYFSIDSLFGEHLCELLHQRTQAMLGPVWYVFI